MSVAHQSLATIIGLALAASIQQNTLRLLLPNLLATQAPTQ
jgi:hypothetical protein